MLKIRRPLGRLIFNMGIAIPGKTVFLIETAPRTPRFSTTTGCEYIDQLGSFILGDGSINDGYIRRNDMHLNQSGTNRLAKNFRLIVKDNVEDITKTRKMDKPKPKSGYRDNSPHDLGTQRKAVHREEMYILCTVPRPGNPGNLCNICGLVCQLLVSKAGTSNVGCNYLPLLCASFRCTTLICGFVYQFHLCQGVVFCNEWHGMISSFHSATERNA